MTTKAKSSADRSARGSHGGRAVGLAVMLGACKHVDETPSPPSVCPDDYRLRHPIAVSEADRSIVVFVGNRPRRYDRRRSAPT